MVVCIYNLNIQEAEAEGSGTQDNQPDLHSVYEASLNNTQLDSILKINKINLIKDKSKFAY